MDFDDLNWEDVRAFVVALDSKSYREAASRLGTTHPTVRRRLASLEAETGLRLFQRNLPGLQPTSEGRELLEVAKGVEQAMVRFARQTRAADEVNRGPVTVTMANATALELAPALTAFTRAWPDIVVTVDTRADFADLGALEADVAIRAFAPGSTPDPSLAGRCAGSVRRAVYGAPDAGCWIASSSSPTWASRTPFPDLPVRCIIAEPTIRLEACRLGMGLAVLPCFMADPHMQRRSEPREGYEIWVLVHPDMRQNPRLKKFRDAMVDALRERAEAYP